eukprot:231568-Hanusia_phi.AAC.1
MVRRTRHGTTHSLSATDRIHRSRTSRESEMCHPMQNLEIRSSGTLQKHLVTSCENHQLSHRDSSLHSDIKGSRANFEPELAADSVTRHHVV